MVTWVALAISAYVLWALAARALMRAPIRNDPIAGLFWLLGVSYAKLMHGLHIKGKAAIPPVNQHARTPAPLIIIANHTAGVDPVLIQAAAPFHIRWMMAQDMRLPQLEWLWSWLQVIFVSRTTRDSLGTREAIRHLNAGGVIGIFPEGGLERPSFHLMPFQPGIGLLIKRTGARVLPVIVDGTPQVDPAWASLWTPSRSCVHFKPTLDYAHSDLSPAEIAADLRQRFHEWTGWPMNDAPAPVETTAPGKSRQIRQAA